MINICSKCGKQLEKPRVRNIRAVCLKCQAKLGNKRSAKNRKKNNKGCIVKNKGI